MTGFILIWTAGFIAGTTMMLFSRTISDQDADPWITAMRVQVIKIGVAGIVVNMLAAFAVELFGP